MGRKSCLIKSLRSVPVPWHKLSLHHAIQRSDVPINISGHLSFKRRTSYSPLLVLPPPPSFICFYFSSLHSLSYPFSSSSSLHSLSYIPCFPLPPFNLLSLSPPFTLYHIPFLPLLVPPAPPEEPQPGRPFKVTPEHGPSSTPVTERLSLGRRDDRYGMLMQP